MGTGRALTSGLKDKRDQWAAQKSPLVLVSSYVMKRWELIHAELVSEICWPSVHLQFTFLTFLSEEKPEK